MSLTHEYELTRQLVECDKEHLSAMEELYTFYNEVMTVGIEKINPKELTEKENKLIDKTVKSFLKTEPIAAQTVKALDSKSKIISQKIIALRGVQVDKDVFENKIAAACPYYDTFSKRPGLYIQLHQVFKNISKLITDPVIARDDLLGPTLAKLVEDIEKCGFVFRLKEDTGNPYEMPAAMTNMFVQTDRGRLQHGKTTKELGYTPDNILTLSTLFSGSKRPGFFSAMWTDIRAAFYSNRFLWDLIAGRSEDDANRFTGIYVRTNRLNIIRSINMHILWHQQLADLNTVSRLVNIVTSSIAHGSEALNLYSLEPSEVVTDEKIVASPDIEVDSTHDIVIPGLEDELEEEMQLLFNLRNINIEKMDGYYFAKEMKDSVKINAYNEYLAYNRKLARMSVELFVPTKKKNEKLVQTLQNSMVLLDRYQKKLSTTIPNNILQKIIVDNIPTQQSFNAHIVAYNTIQKEMKNSFEFISEPVKYEYDLGKLHGLLKTCEFLGFEAINPAGLEHCKSSQFFDINYYDKDVTNITDAGYTTLELHRMSNILRKTANEFIVADSVYSHGVAIDDTDLVAAISNEYQYDEVDPVLAAQARRIRYGLITQVRSQILLDSLLTDTMIMVKIIKRIIDKTK